MPTATVYNWIYRGWITARHVRRNQELDHPRRTTSRCGSYASAGHARPASTPAPAGHSQNKNPARNKEHNHEKATQLDRYQRWPTSTGHLRPAMVTK